MVYVIRGNGNISGTLIKSVTERMQQLKAALKVLLNEKENDSNPLEKHRDCIAAFPIKKEKCIFYYRSSNFKCTNKRLLSIKRAVTDSMYSTCMKRSNCEIVLRRQLKLPDIITALARIAHV